MFCRKCGKEIPDESNVCMFCGENQKTEETKSKGKSKKKKWIIIAVVLVLFVIIASSSGTDTAEPDVSEQTTQGQAEVGKVTEEEETTKSEPSNVFAVGEVLVTNNAKISFVSAEKWYGYSQYLGPEAGNIIVRAYFEFENTGSSDLYYNMYDFSCYADGKVCKEYWSSEDKNLSSGSLSTGRKAEGYVYFEVPETAEEIEIEYETDFWSNKKAIFKVEL